MLFVIVEVKSSDMESKSAPILTHAVVVFCTWIWSIYDREEQQHATQHWGALYYYLIFWTLNYIKFKFYIIAGKKRPPQLRKSGRLFPQLARCGLFCALSFRALGTVQRTMGRNYQCRTVRQQKTTYYICYLFISIWYLFIPFDYSIWNLL